MQKPTMLFQEVVPPKGTKKLLKNGVAHFKYLKCTRVVVFY